MPNTDMDEERRLDHAAVGEVAQGVEWPMS
jgi:hypothetical protein